MNIASSTHTNIITHTGITGLITLRQNQIVHHFTEFTVRVNEQTLASTSSLIQLQKFQLDNRLVFPIWNLSHVSFVPLSTKGNLSASILKCMKHMDFDLRPTFPIDEWSIDGSDIDIISFINFYVQENSIQKALASICRSFIPIFWLNQCLSEDSTSLAPWKLIKNSYGVSTKGRTATWYLAIKDSIHSYDPYDISMNTMAIAHISTTVSSDKRKREWLYTDHLDNTITIGKVASKSRTSAYISVTHWTCCNTDLNLFSPCSGCTINRNDHEPSSCSFSLLRSWSKVIPPSFITDFNRNTGVKTVHIDDLIAF